MELPTLSLSRQGMSLADFGQDVVRRRTTVGDVVMPRNTGNRRTESKRALLAAIEAAGGRW